jgi:hypothetical protein
MNEMNDRERYEEAKKQVGEIKSFYTHLFVYIVVNIFLFLINLLTSRGSWWFYWPLIGWGIGLAAHWFSVFGTSGKFGRQWEQKKIKEIVEKDKSEDPKN